MNKGEIVKTGNMAVDMVYACLQHYKQFGKKVITVTLSHKYWRSFERYLKEQDETFEFTDQVQFKGLLIRKGGALQVIDIIPDLKLEIIN